VDVLLTDAESSRCLRSSQHSDKDTIRPRRVCAQLVRTGTVSNTLDTNSVSVLLCKETVNTAKCVSFSV
jgi:hypothetical protein